MEYYVLLVKKDGEVKNYLTILPPKEAFKKGMNGKAIFGFLKNGT